MLLVSACGEKVQVNEITFGEDGLKLKRGWKALWALWLPRPGWSHLVPIQALSRSVPGGSGMTVGRSGTTHNPARTGTRKASQGCHLAGTEPMRRFMGVQVPAVGKLVRLCRRPITRPGQRAVHSTGVIPWARQA
jgi:hypothetical protein